ncbi:MAG: hypothetical protein EXS59_02680 [Candidatus Taylorbacteria bacterium]|nr:hypothetical protein [Candidatus Taylorbacteria bacterium]
MAGHRNRQFFQRYKYLQLLHSQFWTNFRNNHGFRSGTWRSLQLFVSPKASDAVIRITNLYGYTNRIKQDLRREDLLHPELSYKVIDVLFEVDNSLGAGYIEKYYENAVAGALQAKGLKLAGFCMFLCYLTEKL